MRRLGDRGGGGKSRVGGRACQTQGWTSIGMLELSEGSVAAGDRIHLRFWDIEVLGLTRFQLYSRLKRCRIEVSPE